MPSKIYTFKLLYCKIIHGRQEGREAKQEEKTREEVAKEWREGGKVGGGREVS